MPASTLPAFLDALVAALQLRVGLAGVNIYSCPVDPADLGKEGLEFAEDVSIEQARASMGSRDMEESYTVNGSLLVAAPIAAKGAKVASINAAAKVARDRAMAILSEITDELADNDAMSATVRDVSMASLEVHQGMGGETQLGRVAWVEFTMKVESRVSP